jgi:methylmalonyl-CoA mutase
MSDDLTLGAEFPAATRTQWLKLVDGVLKGAPFDKKLISRTYDGLRIEPLYPRAPAAMPVAGRTPGAAWTLMQRVDHPDPATANAQALQDLENGANGLTLVFAGSVSANGYGLDAAPATLARVLDGVALDSGITIDFNLSPPTRDAVRHFAALVKSRGLDPASVDMRASINPLGGFAASGTSPHPWAALAPRFAALVRELAGQGFGGSRSATAASSTMRAARKRRSWLSRSRAPWSICARWRRPACRSTPHAA